MDTTEDAVLHAGEQFTDTELQVLARHGALTRLLPGVYADPRHGGRPEARAEALWSVAGPVLAAGWTAVGPTAAWLLTGGASPVRLHAAVAHFHRLPAGGSALPWSLVQSDVAAGPDGTAPNESDVQCIGPVRLTRPDRTVEDLLLADDPERTRLAARVIARHGPHGLVDRLARPTRRPGVVGARRRLDAVLLALDAGAAAGPAGGR